MTWRTAASTSSAQASGDPEARLSFSARRSPSPARSAPTPANTRERQVRQVAPGVYTIRRADPTDDFPDGNTTVGDLGQRAVLVVDTCYLPSSADADIALVRGLDRQARALGVLNTHRHNDHVGGNQRYRQAWPGRRGGRT